MASIKELLDNDTKIKLEKEYGIKEQDNGEKDEKKKTKAKNLLKEECSYLNMQCYRNSDVNKNKDIEKKEKEIKKNPLCKNIKIPTINGEKEIENFNLMYNKLIHYDCKEDKIKPCNLTVEKVYYYDKIHSYLSNKSYIFEKLGYKTIVENLIRSLHSPMVIGLGEVSVRETSIKFDHIYGIPYIPASTLKGAYRNYMEKEYVFDYEEEKEEYIDIINELFGTEDSEGELIFVDTYPEQGFKIKNDIMNPHYSNYYDEKESPTDDQDTKPIFFLTLQETKFKFRLFIKEEVFNDRKELIKDSFNKFLDSEALGAKKAVGYGYFKVEGSEKGDKRTSS
ncbi:type III-B CRISPR module RAMP protein Cmr6 [Paramaledivibacter caminithermalis]|uniref:RAMP superfamily protein n=1 Tax=Paramaledivibacter caminithermalis (strain DSM 15212 / CIP 107654 / DViRD3) TaxID=1121301 RepID=A0A1M6QTC7_PARC5|nr:type III-B CRISPR module RAMP protein Cmr6 [Paramaledivibacter caminithermalis]SHK23358.1 RAMP superfamily protein [Paramaledivibacter caminithermalis DSM 15212]